MEIYSLSFFLLVSVGLILYYTVFSRCQWICLLGLSLVFFAASGWQDFAFLLFTALTVWGGGLCLAKLDTDAAARKERRFAAGGNVKAVAETRERVQRLPRRAAGELSDAGLL